MVLNSSNEASEIACWAASRDQAPAPNIADAATVAFSRRKQPLSDGFVPAEDVADAAVYLLSSEARAVTGQTITVDGGWSVLPVGD